MSVSNVSNVSAPVQGLVDLSSVVEAVNATVPEKGLPVTATKPAPVKPATAANITKGMTALVEAIEASIYSGGNVFVTLAAFAENAGIAGQRERAVATLTLLAKDPDKYVPSKAAPNVRKRIARIADKGVDASEHSRAISALTAGSVLCYYVAEARKVFEQDPANTAGFTRVVSRLLAPCAEARTELGKAVPSGWNGSPKVTLSTILAKAKDTEASAQASTAAARATSGNAVGGSSGSAAGATGTAGRTVNTGSTGSSVPNIPSSTQAAPTATQSASVPTPAQAQAQTAPTGPQEPAHIKHLQGIEGIVSGMRKAVPDPLRASVEAELAKIEASCNAIRKAYSQELGKAKSPATDLLHLTGGMGSFNWNYKLS